ncbi:MAG: hypothetical protein FJZ11_03325 [Candidatus Omnitrophica bacterium]|nr:hypothetical protein [Candidatus Omnitrophota bacterium]
MNEEPNKEQVNSLFNKLLSEKPEEKDPLQKNLLKELQTISSRKTFAYLANFKTYPHNMINFDDKSFVSALMDSIPKTTEAIDFILHSPGGFAESTEMIVKLLRSRYKHIRFIIPHSAKSAATMLALSGNEILMTPSAELGPIDPQVSGAISGPAQSIIDGFNDIKKIVDKEKKLNGAYVPLLNKMDVATIKQCETALNYGINLVRDWIAKYMFEEEKAKPAIKKLKARFIAKFFSDHRRHLTHGRPIIYGEAAKVGVRVKNVEEVNLDYAEKLKEYYMRFEGIFSMNSRINKIFQSENEYMVNLTPVVQLIGPLPFPHLPISPPVPPQNPQQK